MAGSFTLEKGRGMNFDFSLSGPVKSGACLGELYAPIQTAGPVFWNDTLQGWMITGYREVKAVLKRHRQFQNGRSPQRSAFGYEAMLFNDDGLHNRMRAVWATSVLPAAVAERMAALSRVAQARQSEFCAKLAQGEPVDLVAVFQDYTTDITTMLMEVDDARRADFKRWNAIISGTAQLALGPDDPRISERDRAREELYAFLAEEVTRHKSRLKAGPPATDLMSMMIVAEGQEGITAQVVLDNLVNLFLGALDTTVRLLGSVAVQLLQHRDVLESVAADPASFGKVLEEIHRYQPVVQVTTRHFAGEAMELGGATLRDGEMIYIMPGISCWDATVFPESQRFDPSRVFDPEHQHLGFGFGLHQCLGMHLARAEIAAFFLPLLQEMKDWKIAAMDYGPSWSLWGPVRLEVRKGS